jgi:hypothetical protein
MLESKAIEQTAPPRPLWGRCLLSGAVFLATVRMVHCYREIAGLYETTWIFKQVLIEGIIGSLGGAFSGVFVGYALDAVRFRRWNRARV